MSNRNLKVVPMAPEDEWVRKLAELIDGDQWSLADTLVDHYPLDEFPDAGDANNGLRVALREDELALARRYGIIAKEKYLANIRMTAVRWPRGERSPRASFDVHYRMRGQDRQSEMKKRLRQADREGMALSARMLQRLRADENPKPPRQFDERVRRAIANAVRREVLGGRQADRKDWWMLERFVPGLTAEDAQANRDVAVRELRALASAIAKGEIAP